MSEQPWTLLSLAPLPVDVLTLIFGGLPLDILTVDTLAELSPADRSRVEIILADWRPGRPGLDRGTVAALPRLAFVQQPSVGVQSHDGEALAAVRSEERRVGKECTVLCRSRWSPYH